jgi:multisubunit Na+/H+ antiporter MnhC subunit
VINASEISDFVYCERSWWLRRHNYFGRLNLQSVPEEEARLKAGTEYHAEYAHSVRRGASWEQSKRKIVIAISFLIGIALLALLLLGRAHGGIAKPRIHPQGDHANSLPNTPPTRRPTPVLQIVVGAIACGAAVLLIVLFLLRRTARVSQANWRIPQGGLAYVGDEKAELFMSRKSAKPLNWEIREHPMTIM